MTNLTLNEDASQEGRARELETKIVRFLDENSSWLELRPGAYISTTAPGTNEAVCAACALGTVALMCDLYLKGDSIGITGIVESRIRMDLRSSTPLTKDEIDELEVGFEGKSFYWTGSRDEESPFYRLGQRLRRRADGLDPNKEA